MKRLIVGAKGQLGSEFLRKFPDAVAVDYEECDVGNLDEVLKLFESVRPSLVINCSAYNLVDRAEVEFDKAFRVNALGVRNLAYACRKFGAFLVHYSTDYVFDGEKLEAPYEEGDPPNPLNSYGRSKLAGERYLREELSARYLTFRVSWVYGRGKQNFVYKLLSWAKENPYLKVVCDEVSVPTSTRTIVEFTVKALDAGLTGLFHLVNNGQASRYEWAKAAFRVLGVKKFIRPVPASSFSLPAKRPLFSAMSPKRLEGALSLEVPYWEEELYNFLLEIYGS